MAGYRKFPDRRRRGFMIARYEVLHTLVMMQRPMTAHEIFYRGTVGGCITRFLHIYRYLHKLENAGYIRRAGKKSRVDESGGWDLTSGWGTLWEVTEKGKRFYWDYIDPNRKEGRLIRA